MVGQALQNYYVFFKDEWHIPEPAYYFVDVVQGRNPNDALERNLPHLLGAVRKILDVGEAEVAEYKLEEALYIVPTDYWMSSREAYWQASLGSSLAS